MRQLLIIIIFIPLLSITSCKKYLDVKSNGALVLPDHLAALQGLLTSTFVINAASIGCTTTNCDDYYITPATFELGAPVDKNMYTWQNNNPEIDSYDWASSFTIVYYANAVLENIDKITIDPSETEALKATKGTAFFLRAKTNLSVALAYAKGYDVSTASTEPGIPLRMSTDFNQKDERSSLEATYQQIISDLKNAISLLPKQAISYFQPSKPAAYGMLARAYLSMRDYQNCQLYADSSLQIKNDLVDYNTIVGSPQPFPLGEMPEVEFGSSFYGPTYIYDPYGLIDSTLMQSYDINDLRKSVFFTDHGDNTYSFNSVSSYFPFGNFDGIATDEVYLMRAECLARNGDVTSAMHDLDELLRNRYSNTVPYLDHTITDKTQALDLILLERRKELIFRGLRWMDLKRLNLEGANITLKRILGDKVYTLAPNSPRYAIPIPDDVIKLSGMQQNQY